MKKEPVRPGSLLHKHIAQGKLRPKEPLGPPPKKQKTMELSIHEALTKAAVPDDDIVKHYSIVFTVDEEALADDPQKEFLSRVAGVYHQIGLGNQKPIWKGEEAGTAISRNAPREIAYLWWCESYGHFTLTSEPMNEEWNDQLIFGMLDETLKVLYSPWNSDHACRIAKFESLYDWTMGRILKLEDTIHDMEVTKVDDTVPAETPAVAPAVGDGGVASGSGGVGGGDGGAQCITLSSGEVLPRPPPPPGAKGAPYVSPILKTGWKPKMVALLVAMRMNLWEKVNQLVAK